MVGPGKENALSDSAYRAAIDYIRSHSEIWEVILTGGDPLMLAPRRMKEIMTDLAATGHVKVIRLHTRVPVADPARISDEMTAALKVAGATTWVAVHANHARELTGPARAACARLVDAGIPLVSQSVLLRGVNDTIGALSDLMRAFVECRIKPYYLHHGDLAPGTAHLRTTLAEGQDLMRELRGRVSGLCQPDYVIDIPGGAGKSPVGPNYVLAVQNTAGDTREAETETRYRIVDYCGEVHLYPPEA
jgi:lysine 2,3-aminomutase